MNSLLDDRYIDSLLKIASLEKVYLYNEYKSFEKRNDSLTNTIIDFGYNEFKKILKIEFSFTPEKNQLRLIKIIY